MVRPLANVLGHLQADDDIMSFSPAPHDLRSAAVEGQDSFDVLHADAEVPGITKYAAMFARDGSGPSRRHREGLFYRFFHVEDEQMKESNVEASIALHVGWMLCGPPVSTRISSKMRAM